MTKVTKYWNIHIDTFNNAKYKFCNASPCTCFLTYEKFYEYYTTCQLSSEHGENKNDSKWQDTVNQKLLSLSRCEKESVKGKGKTSKRENYIFGRRRMIVEICRHQASVQSLINLQNFQRNFLSIELCLLVSAILRTFILCTCVYEAEISFCAKLFCNYLDFHACHLFLNLQTIIHWY